MLPAVHRAEQDAADADRRLPWPQQSKIIVPSRVVSVPSRFAPILTRTTLCGRRIGARELLHARVGHAHGSADRHGHGRDRGLEEPELAAEPAADGLRVERDLVVGESEHVRHLAAGVEQRLGRCVHDHVAERIDHRAAGLGLQVALVDPAGGELSFDDQVGLVEACLDVAALKFGAAGNVGRLVAVHLGLGLRRRAVHRHLFRVDLVALAHDGRILRHRRQQIDSHRQRLVLDPHGGNAVLGRRLGLGQDRGDGWPGMDHPIQGEQDDPALDGGLDVDDGQIAGGHHRDHAGDRQRLGLVDGHDARGCVLAGHEASVECARQ